MIELTIGMATYDDVDGVYFTVQALRMYHHEALRRCELVVVDNNPDSPHGQMVRGLIENWVAGQDRARYIPQPEPVGTSASRDRVFQEAAGDAVMCTDSHVLFAPGSIDRLLEFYDDNPDCLDLLSGPMYCDNLASVHTHFDDVWRAEMWGIWGHDARGDDPDAEPFEIPAMGLGLFTCRKDAWLGFHPHARGFGGEEFYIHTKFRQAGRKCLCLPFLRWAHRFGRPNGVPYPLTQWNKVRNYVLEHQELGLPLDRIYRHFVTLDPETLPDGTLAEPAVNAMNQHHWDYLVADPVTRTAPPPALAPPSNPNPAGCGGCGGNQRPAVSARSANSHPTDLETLYRRAVEQPSDINEHVPKLRELASQCEHVTEFGKRRGVSTVGLLAGQPKQLVTYDLVPDRIDAVLTKCRGETQFTFRRQDVLEAEIDSTDMLFIDTKHTAGQLAAELARHAEKVRRWIVLHDTTIFGFRGEDGGPGLLVALRRYLREHPEWSVIYHVTNNHGLTVISRAAEDKPKPPGPVELAANFGRALAEHVRKGAREASRELLQARLEACTLCDQRTGERCSVCGCPIVAKASWREQDCDLARWPEPETIGDHDTDQKKRSWLKRIVPNWAGRMRDANAPKQP